MKLLASIILALTLSGCRFAIVPMPSGKVAYVGSLLTDPHWTKAEIRKDGSVILTGYMSSIDADATKAIVSGVVQGVLKSAIPIP